MKLINKQAFVHADIQKKGDATRPRTEPRKYQYSTLMQVNISNTYYNGSTEKGADFRIYPTQTTKAIMKNLGLIFREHKTGFSIIYNTFTEEELIQYLKNHGTKKPEEYWSKLSFVAAQNNPLFVNFTDLPFDVDLTARNIYLSNETAHRDNNEIILNNSGWYIPYRGKIKILPNNNQYVSSRSVDFIEVIPANYAVPFDIGLGEKFIDVIMVTDISGEKFIHVDRYPKDGESMVERTTAYLCFTEVPEGRYTINWVHSGETVHQIVVLYIATLSTRLCFIDLLFSRPKEDTKGFYPVNLEGKGSITPLQYHLKFKARNIHWVYWIISSSQQLKKMRIEADGNNDIVFDGPTKGSIPTGETAWQFVSNTIIPMQHRSPLRFKLVALPSDCHCESSCDCKSRVIVSPLPLVSSSQILNASLPHSDSSDHSQEKKYSEVYVYV